LGKDFDCLLASSSNAPGMVADTRFDNRGVEWEKENSLKELPLVEERGFPIWK